jgi:putative endopeptidase
MIHTNWDKELNKNFSPKNDFFNYVNDNWLRNNPIPSDQNTWGQFSIINENNRNRVREILESISDDIVFKQAQMLYKGFMNKSGQIYLDKLLDKIMNIKNLSEFKNIWFNLICDQLIDSPISYYVYPDLNNSERNILYVSVSGLGLPDRDYYLLDDMKEKREKYFEFMKIFYPRKIDYEGVFNLEKQLASWNWTKVEKRDPKNYNNPTNYDEFIKKYPNLLCKEFFDMVNIEGDTINISNPKFLKNFNDLLIDDNLPLLKNYLSWNIILNNASIVDEKYTKKSFKFYGTYLSGIPTMKSVWKRAISYVNSQLGEVVGLEFCKKYFPESSKKNCLLMVDYIKKELKSRLENNDWMVPETKKKAVDKLKKIRLKIGYPEKDGLTDYSSLRLNSELTLFENNIIMNRFDVKQHFSELYQLKNKNRFHMNPHTVNAYYSPLNNEIVFPAGILQFPFFDATYNMIENFGGIGSVIGHEITHGFDDQGRKFDANGNLNDWWEDSDAYAYQKKTDLIKNLYGSFQISDQKINGELTLGENIADLGGVSIALSAMLSYLRDHPEKKTHKYTPIQRFLFSFARVWRNQLRPEEELNRLITDPHSPPKYRVNGVLMNLPKFYEEYNLSLDDSLYQDSDKIGSVW